MVDLIKMKAYRFTGPHGENMEVEEIPADMVDLAKTRRSQLIEAVADLDEEIADLYLMEEEPTEEQLVAAIRKATIARTLVPVTVGSALKNTGVQAMLDAVVAYLPSPGEVGPLDLPLTSLLLIGRGRVGPLDRANSHGQCDLIACCLVTICSVT